MIAIVSTLITIVMLMFGGTGAAIFASQSSLPDQPLYSVKLAGEDVRASLPATGQTRVGLAMDFADLRLQEALQLAAEGKPIPATVWERMDNHLSLGLNTAAGMDDEQLAQQLLQIQARMQAELEKLGQLQADSRYSRAVEKIQVDLQINLQLVAIGLNDPAAFRLYMHSGQHHTDWQVDPTASPIATSTATNQPTQAAPTSIVTATQLDPTSTATATVQPTQPAPTSTATAQPTANPKAPAPKAPNPGTNSNGHPHGCCCPWCRGGGGSGGHHGGGWHH